MFPYAYEVPVSKQVRVIMNTDAKNEADDQFAIVHGLLTSKFSIEGLIGAHFGTQRTNNSMEESYQEIHVFDPRYNRMPISQYAQQCGADEILVLYQTANFAEDANVGLLSR